MERTDQHILALLEREGRMSYTDIGKATGLSTSAAQQRVRRLEQRGIIKGYHAYIDAAALGRDLTAFISVRALDSHSDESVLGILEGFDEIVSCYSTAGDSSYLCKAEVDTTAALDSLLTRLRNAANVMTVTTVVLTTPFRDRPLISLPAEEEETDA